MLFSTKFPRPFLFLFYYYVVEQQMKPLSYFIHFSQSKKYIHSIIPYTSKEKIIFEQAEKKVKKSKASGPPALPHSYI